VSTAVGRREDVVVRRRRRPGQRSDLPARVLRQVVLIVATLICLYPIVFMLTTALKTNHQYLNDTFGLPWPLDFSHFRAAMDGGAFGTWFKNSLILTAGSVIVSTACAVLAAYAIARMRFRGQRTFLALNMALMVVPPVTMLIPLFAEFDQLGLVSTYQGAILVYAGLTMPFSVFMLTSFFRTIPDELIDSAMADGASTFRILWQILTPLSGPALITLVVVNSLWVWNELLIALTFLPDDRLKTLMVGITTVFSGRYTLDVPTMMAGMLLTAAPMVLLYLLGQRFFIRGLTAGALKG
jgi:ABC-type glycerol-3-phosphate transport system permease component